MCNKKIFTLHSATATYINAMKTKKQYSQLTFLERQVMEMAVSVFNGDVYCIGMHEHFLRKTNTFSEEDINELKIGGLPSQKDLHPVLKATRLILTRKGNVTDAERSYLEDIGITRPKMYEIAASICQKGVQNYINNIAKPTLDDEFK